MLKSWQAYRTNGMVSRYNFGFGRGVTHACLAFTCRRRGEKRVGSTYAREDPSRALACGFIACKIGIAVNYKFPFRGRVPYPGIELGVQGSIYVAHEPVKGLVTVHTPFGDPCRKKATRP